MPPVLTLSVWLTNPKPSTNIEVTSPKLNSERQFIPAAMVLKHLPDAGYGPKPKRESAQSQVGRVLAQRVATTAETGELFKELPCQELLQSFGDQSVKKCKKENPLEHHLQCKKKSHSKCDKNQFPKNHIDCPVICPLCVLKPGSKVFGTRYSLGGHMVSKHKISPHMVTFGSFPCDCCGSILANEKSLKMHKIKMQAKALKLGQLPSIAPGAHYCELCGKNFVEKEKLRSHVKVHANEHPVSKYITPELRRALITENHQKKSKLPNQDRLLCDEPKCEKSFSNAPNFRRHKNKVHWSHLDAASRKKNGLTIGNSARYKAAYAYKQLQNFAARFSPILANSYI